MTSDSAAAAASLRRVRLCATPQTAAHQAPPSWDSPGKDTGVGCHFLLQCMEVKSDSEVTQSCPTLYVPMDCSPPGSSTMGSSRQEHWSGLPFPSPMHGSEKWKWSRSVVSDSSRPHGLKPTRLLHPWDFLGKNTGVGCHCLLQCMEVKSESEVTQSCPTPSDPVDWSPPGSSTHGIFQAGVLEWGAIAFSMSDNDYTLILLSPFVGLLQHKMTQWLIPLPKQVTVKHLQIKDYIMPVWSEEILVIPHNRGQFTFRRGKNNKKSSLVPKLASFHLTKAIRIVALDYSWESLGLQGDPTSPS